MATIFDGTSFYRLSSDTLQDDSPLHTGAVSVLRNNQIYLGRSMDECGWVNRTTTNTSDDAFNAYSSMNYSAVVYGPWKLTRPNSKLTSKITYKVTSPTSTNPGTGDVDLKFFIADGNTKKIIQSVPAQPDEVQTVTFNEESIQLNKGSNFHGNLIAGWMIKTGFPSGNDEPVTFFNKVIGRPMEGTLNDINSRPPNNGALGLELTNTGIKCDVVLNWGGYLYTSDTLNLSWVGGLEELSSGSSQNVEFGQLAQVNILNYTIREEGTSNWDGGERFNQLAPNNKCRYSGGSGGHVRLHDKVARKTVTDSIGFQPPDRPNVEWNRFPSTRRVESGTTESWKHNFHARDAANPTMYNPILLIAVDLDSYDEDHIRSGEGELGATNIDVDIKLETLSLAGLTQDSKTKTFNIPSYPLSTTPKFPFLFQAFLEKWATGITDKHIDRDGQLFDDGKGEMDLIEWAEIELPLVNTSSQEPNIAKTTVDMSNTASSHKIYVLGSSIHWRSIT